MHPMGRQRLSRAQQMVIGGLLLGVFGVAMGAVLIAAVGGVLLLAGLIGMAVTGE